jgi:hypothetical protein
MESKESRGIIGRLVSGGVVVAGAVLYIINTAPDIKEKVAVLGIPSWGWQIISLFIVIAGMAYPSYTMYIENKKMQGAYDAKLLEDRKQLRERLKDRQEIPTILSQMSERALTLMDGEKQQGKSFSKEEIQMIVAGLAGIDYSMPARLVDGMKYIAKYQSPLHPDILTSKKLDKFWPEFEMLLLALQGSMKNLGMGTMALCQDDPPYQSLAKRLEELEVDLPQAINQRIIHYTLVITSLPNILLINPEIPDQMPAHKGAPVVMPYLAKALRSYGGKYNYQISRLIERFLSGEDMR